MQPSSLGHTPALPAQAYGDRIEGAVDTPEQTTTDRPSLYASSESDLSYAPSTASTPTPYHDGPFHPSSPNNSTTPYHEPPSHQPLELRRSRSRAASHTSRSSNASRYSHSKHCPTVFTRFMAHMAAPIRSSFLAELELLILTLCTGLQDAISFPDYHCFASNQTGNTVFLSLALVLPKSAQDSLFVTPNIGTALGMFLLGGWLTGQLGNLVGPRKRGWLVGCNLLQTVLVAVVAAMQYRWVVESEGGRAVTVVGLLAFAAGSQVVQSRSLAMTEISTAMATAAWIDLMIDPRLFKVSFPALLGRFCPQRRGSEIKVGGQGGEKNEKNVAKKRESKTRPRNRRIAFLVTLVTGSLIGAVVYTHVGSATAIALSAGGKLLVTILYLFNEAERVEQENDAVV